MIFKLALRELIRNKRFVLFFSLNLALGLTGFVALESFKASLVGHMAKNARNILTADLEVSARRALTENELQVVNKAMTELGTSSTPSSSVSYTFYAMLSVGERSRLVQVRSIQDNFPLYGNIELRSGQVIESSSSKEDLKAGKIWVAPEVLSQFGAELGAKGKLGQLEVTLSDVVEKTSAQTFRGASFAPTIYAYHGLMPASGLIQYGSTFTERHLYKFPQNVDTKTLQEKLFQGLTDPGIQIENWQEAGDDAGRQLGYLADYLGLVALVALFMSALGAAYIYRLYLSGRLKEIAIYRSLGVQASEAVGIYLLQAAAMGLAAAVPTLLLAHLVLPLLGGTLSQFLPFFLEVGLNLRIVVMTLLMGVVGSLFLSLPFMSRIFYVKPARLFSEEKFQVQIDVQSWLWFLPALVFFSILSVYQANSFRVGLGFVAGLLVTMALIAGLGLLKIVSLARLNLFKKWSLKYSLLGLARKKTSTMALFIALGLGSLLINILPQLKVSLQNEFAFENTSKLPSLFMFDIQDEQIPRLQALLDENKIEKVSSSPLVRARILKINDQDYERAAQTEGFKTREEEREARMRNRGVNLTYRETLSDSEEIVEGVPFSGVYSGDGSTPAEVSIEFRFADRLDLKLGDILTFDVQGVELAAKVVNFRKVRWTSFQPNFFVTFQAGVLDAAPKTHIMALPAMSSEKKDRIQNVLGTELANISMIDVSSTVGDVLKVAEQMSWSLELMAGLALLTGYVVLFSIVRTQVRTRRWEVNMLKVLGAGFSGLGLFLVAEGFWVALVASIFGAGLSVLASWVLSQFLFEGAFVLNLFWPLLSVFGITLLSLLISLVASLDILREKPLSILRGEE